MRRNTTEPKDEGAISNCQAQNVNLGIQLLSVALPTDEHKIIAGTLLLARGKLLKLLDRKRNRSGFLAETTPVEVAKHLVSL